MGWTLPAVGDVTSPYGPRILAGAVGDYHFGTDIGAKRGPVYAAREGVVRRIWQTSKGAWVVDIRHPDEGGKQIRTRYVHMYLADIQVKTGQHVAAGQQIGRSGASGTSAAHLHLEVMVNDMYTNPEPFFAARGVRLGAQSSTTTGGTAPTTTAPPEDDMYTDLDRYSDNLVLGAVGRIEAKLYNLAQQVGAVDVDEKAVAASVAALLIPPVVAAIAQQVPLSAEQIKEAAEAALREVLGGLDQA